jgi:hypothetical protein
VRRVRALRIGQCGKSLHGEFAIKSEKSPPTVWITLVYAWNTAQMQTVLDRWAHRRQIVPPELIGRIAPTRLEGINLRGVFRFPVERYAGQLLPSQMAAKTSASG